MNPPEPINKAFNPTITLKKWRNTRMKELIETIKDFMSMDNDEMISEMKVYYNAKFLQKKYQNSYKFLTIFT